MQNPLRSFFCILEYAEIVDGAIVLPIYELNLEKKKEEVYFHEPPTFSVSLLYHLFVSSLQTWSPCWLARVSLHKY